MTPMRLAGHLQSIMFHPLSRERPFGALARYARWQIGSRLVPGPVVVPLTDRGKLIVSRGMTGATCNIYSGLHDFAAMSFTAHLLRPGDVFGDVGANVGAYTVLAGAVAGARCVSYEPAADTFNHLCANVAANKIDAELILAAVGAKAGTIRFTRGRDTTNRVAIDGEESVEVSVVTLDETCPDATLLKIDVEGFEQEVLAGAEKLMTSPNLLAVIMETNESGGRYGGGNESLLEKMTGYGFEAVCYDPFTRLLSLPRPDRDTILIKNVLQVQERLRSGPTFRVLGQTI